MIRSRNLVHHHPTPETYTALIAALQAGDWVATDADGTLWAGDVGDDTVRCAAAQADWPSVDLDAYLALMETDYHAGCRAAADVLRGLPQAEAIDQLAAFFAPRITARTPLVDALRAAERRGVVVRIVTASPTWAAAAGSRLIGVDWPIFGIECLGDTPGLFAEPVTVEHGKVAAWKARDLPPPALAFGDSRWDRPLLESAQTGVMLAPFEIGGAAP